MSFTFTAPVKDPDATLRHGMDWSAWLEDGETITTQTVTGEGLVLDQVSEDAGVVSWRVSGGIATQDYVATVRVTTSLGRIDDRSVQYRVRER